MNERQLKRKLRTLLNGLDIHPPLDVKQLCSRLGEQRGKPIRLRAHPIPVPGPFGVWIATGDADYILYQQETTPAHQDHIILHELGHMLAGHQGEQGVDDLPRDSFPGLAPDDLHPGLTPDAVRKAMRRTAYDTAHEREAELVATIILEWASVADRVAPRLSPADPHVQRVEDALGDRVGWL